MAHANTDNPPKPTYYPLPASVSWSQFDQHALRVVDVLQRAGFEAYIVGGGVRDLLLGKAPKDFDVATNATPTQIKELFANCRLIGKRFRLAHIYYQRHIIEVATFRGSHASEKEEGITVTKAGMIARDNVFGTVAEDANRRDFTINALYFNPSTKQVMDYVGGMQDMEHGVIRSIGDPVVRFEEDPVRILRALRFQTKLDFQLDAAIIAAQASIYPRLLEISNSRLFEEYRKLFCHGRAQKNYAALTARGVFQCLFAQTTPYLDDPDFQAFMTQALTNTDYRIEQALGVNPAFLMACFLWPAFSARYKMYMNEKNMAFSPAIHLAGNDVLGAQLRIIGLPKRFSVLIKTMWLLQFALMRRQPKKVMRLLQHKSFRAAYDFLLLRVVSHEVSENVATWWTDIQAASSSQQKKMIHALKHASNRPDKKG